MSDIDTTLLSQIQQDAEHLARTASDILRDEQEKFTIQTFKDSAGVDIATSADLKSEKYIMDFIHRKYPTHGIYAEESGVTETNGHYVWVIDPLDGTKEYVRGLSEYNCLIAVEYKNEVVVGVIFRNGVNELYSALKGESGRLNGKPIHVSGEVDISKAFIGFHMPTKALNDGKIEFQMNVLNRFVKQSYRVRPGWDDAKCAGWVARGVLDAHVIFDFAGWYDIAPAVLLVEEAGGIVTDLSGNPIINRHLSNGMILSNKAIHPKILDILKSVQN
jgi:myo-inositol-1(or 4)-monophosphatase